MDKLSKTAQDLIIDNLKIFEGFRDHIYDDGCGNQTIGYGHMLTPPEIVSKIYQDGISLDEGERLLRVDIANALEWVRRKFVNFDSLPPAGQAALVDMSFNLGSRFNPTNWPSFFKASCDPMDWHKMADECQRNFYDKNKVNDWQIKSAKHPRNLWTSTALRNCQ